MADVTVIKHSVHHTHRGVCQEQFSFTLALESLFSKPPVKTKKDGLNCCLSLIHTVNPFIHTQTGWFISAQCRRTIRLSNVPILPVAFHYRLLPPKQYNEYERKHLQHVDTLCFSCFWLLVLPRVKSSGIRDAGVHPAGGPTDLITHHRLSDALVAEWE